MRFWGISDLHLSFGRPKPMDMFGPIWVDHPAKIESNWRARVAPEDVVFVPGDLSWATDLSGAAPDIEYLGRLPGTKVIVKGNHDWWWESLGKIKRALHKSVVPLQHTSAAFGRVAVCGTRGWDLPGAFDWDEAKDGPNLKREVERLRMAAAGLPSGEVRVALLHYPPLLKDEATPFTEVLEAAKVDLCVYGHLHRSGDFTPVNATRRGVRYVNVSCDFVDFTPVEVL